MRSRAVVRAFDSHASGARAPAARARVALGRTRIPDVRACLIALALAMVPPAARAQVPDPFASQSLFSFPGAVTNPASARSAGLALADRWLGEQPFENPAAAVHRGVSGSPEFLRINRQDLRAHDRELTETTGFVDAAGGVLAVPVGRVSAALYAWQPVLRHEEEAYLRGTPGSIQPPASIGQSEALRETRVGLALSTALTALHVGIAGEWWRRDDDVLYIERSGVANPLRSEATLQGSGGALRAGASMAVGAASHPLLQVGAGIGYVMAADLDLALHVDSLAREATGDSSATVRREGFWEGGVSARIAAGSGFSIVAGAGGAASHDWGALGFTSGTTSSWGLAAEYHDATAPWTARAGFGSESMPGRSEPRAGVVGLGVGWASQGFDLDAAIAHRTLQRPGAPDSHDDRIVVTVTVPF